MREAALQAVSLREISAPIPVAIDDPSYPALQSIQPPYVEVPPASTDDATAIQAIQPPPVKIPPAFTNDAAANRKRTERPDTPQELCDNTTNALERPQKRARTGETNPHTDRVHRDNSLGGKPDVEIVQVVANALPPPEVGSGAKHRDLEIQEVSPVPMTVVGDVKPAGVSDGGNHVARGKQAPSLSPSKAASPSVGVKGADEEQLVKTYGLYRVHPVPILGDDERWLGCNFCHKFPSKKSKRHFLITRSPYREPAILRHIVKLHKSEWMEFQLLTEYEKKHFFSAVTYPAPEVFRSRAEELMKAWELTGVFGKQRGSANVKSNKKVKAKAEAKAEAKVKVMAKKKLDEGNDGVVLGNKNEQRAPGENHVSSQAKATNSGAVTQTWRGVKKASSEERLAGRKLYGGKESSRKEFEIAMQREGICHRASEIGGVFLLSSLLEYFEEIGPVHSGVADLVLEGALSDKELRAGGGSRGLIFSPEDSAQGDKVFHCDTRTPLEGGTTKMQRLAAFTLFHMLRGIPPSITSSLCRYVSNRMQPTEHERSREEHVLKQELDFNGSIGINSKVDVKEATPEITHVTDAKDQWAEKFRSQFREFANVGDHLFWNTSNSICAQALYLLRKLLSDNKVNKVLVLTTRKCEEHGDGAIEFLVSVRNRNRSPVWAHLLSVRYQDGAADSLISVLNCVAANWRKRLVGVRSGLYEVERKEKELEQTIVRRLQKELVSGESFSYISRKEASSFQISLHPLASEPQNEAHANIDAAKQPAFGQEEANGFSSRSTDAANHRSNAEAHGEVIKADLQSNAILDSPRQPVDKPFPDEAVWSMSLPSSGNALMRERLNLLRGPNAATASRRAVDPLLERVMWARVLVCLHSMNARDAKVLKRDKKGNPRNLAPQTARISQAWGLNWSNCDSEGGMQLAAGLKSREIH